MGSVFKKIRLLFGRGDLVVVDSSFAATIAGMQNDLDAYDFVITNILGYLNGKFGPSSKSPAIRKGIAHSENVNFNIDMLYEAAVRLRTDYEKLKADYERLEKSIRDE